MKQVLRRLNEKRWAGAVMVLALFIQIALTGCGANSAKKQYVLAERLWSDGKYSAAVSEFERVVAKDSRGKLGMQALLRAANTQAFFLSQYNDAIRKFRTYTEWDKDSPASWEAQKQIGEILFAKTENYDQAIQHYQQLLKLKPNSPEAPEFNYRIAKSYFFLWQFDEAIRLYQDLATRYSGSPWGERALYEIGVTQFTRGEQSSGGRGPGSNVYQGAIDAFQKFIKTYPNSGWVPQARFGIASCLEEMDQLDAAYHAYEELKGSYPSPKVIQIKLHRIRERKTQRSR